MYRKIKSSLKCHHESMQLLVTISLLLHLESLWILWTNQNPNPLYYYCTEVFIQTSVKYTYTHSYHRLFRMHTHIIYLYASVHPTATICVCIQIIPVVLNSYIILLFIYIISNMSGPKRLCTYFVAVFITWDSN